MIEQKLRHMEERFHEVEKLLGDPATMSIQSKFKELSQEHFYLQPIMQQYAQFKRLKHELAGIDELKNSTDTEMRLIAASEHEQLSAQLASLEQDLKLAILPRDPNEGKGIIVEIRAGTGGEEAALFVGDLMRMYSRFAEAQGLKVEPMDSNPTGIGGFKEVIFGITGPNAWKYYKYERGIHRVQRVPATEAAGRIHTSAVSVAVLPEVEEVEIDIKPEDLRIDTYKASGAGGQHVNKTESAIRITHIPSCVVVACQDERSQQKNRVKAMKILLARLNEQKVIEQEKSMSSERKSQIGTGDRSEKIRTYNYPQNRITDHRINWSIHRLPEVVEGDMMEMVRALIKADQERMLGTQSSF
jgi:peptide chain release factor 1